MPKITPVDIVERKSAKTGRYGCGPFTPNCLQGLHNPKFLLFCMCFGIFAQRAAFSLFPTIVTTITRRYQLSTTQIGFITSFNDIIGVLIAIFVAHYGEKGHKGRWIAVSFIVALIAIVVYTIPQWISDPLISSNELPQNASSRASSNIYLCQTQDSPEKCSKSDIESSWLAAPFWLFTFAAVLAAVSASPFGILSSPYLDENVMQTSSPVYLAILFGSSLFAAAFGFGISGFVLRVYGDFYRLRPGQVPPPVNDPSFYGAWWLGYVFAMPIMALAIFPMFGFARELPQKEKYRARDIEQTHGGEKEFFGGKWSDYPKALKVLAVNPVFMLHLVRAAVQLFFISGIVLFLPLYFEQILGFPRSLSGLLTGIILLVPAFIGTIISSVIMKKREMTSKTLLIFALVLSIIGLFPGFGFLAGCSTPKLAGVNQNYADQANDDGKYQLNVTCNFGCSCKLSEYRPICYKERDLAFYNPCFAGCRNRNGTGEDAVFSDCKCLTESFGAGAVAQNGVCPLSKRCTQRKALILILIVFSFFIGGMEVQPMIQLGLRTIPFSQRTMANGIKNVVIKLFGFAPGPVVFGYYLDKACLQRLRKCGKDGACARYDNDSIAFSLTMVTVATEVIVLLCNLISLLFYKPPKDRSLASKMWHKITGKHIEVQEISEGQS